MFNDTFSINSNTRGSIVIYDLIGKIIKSEKIDLEITNLDLSNYPNGIYLIK
ncbi:MAG: T9SS type A sorting domain-containing protein [Flavobacterium sp.]|uniref:T9SS type A sorting domain-containing protein n=1 Tax=Flavobacterium sp. TaxID=239 RepID=UPI0032654B39